MNLGKSGLGKVQKVGRKISLITQFRPKDKKVTPTATPKSGLIRKSQKMGTATTEVIHQAPDDVKSPTGIVSRAKKYWP